ncbi:hypothetical protein C1Y63_11850 [Corynebacterium sp. 13CS0277]|uniref:MFS transporter n=1 Tax=Corynebacterium sp. 13CS0277 TaxID=2071994 RepID=UPI000D036C93|nr:MFS transporter [Corynebacterium sp. 13CS0277]PRQ10364.1 hypothetical protein C1Y63_11850 [Corynebacterium sp. 13CS0277]
MTMNNQARLRRLITGSIFTNFGDSVLFVGFMAWATTVGGSATYGAICSWLVFAPRLLGPLYGAFADRHEPGKIIGVASILLATVLGAFAYAFTLDETALMILLCCGAYGVVGSFFDPALAGLIPRMFGQEEEVLLKVQGTVSTVNQTFQLFIPFVGALMFKHLGGTVALAITAAAFVIGGIIMWGLRLPVKPGAAQVTADSATGAAGAEPVGVASGGTAPAAAGGAEPVEHPHSAEAATEADAAVADEEARPYMSVWRKSLTGWGLVWRLPKLRIHVVIAMCVMGVVGALEAGALGFITDDLGVDPEWIGYMLGMQGIGVVAGMAVCIRAARKTSLLTLEVVGIIATGAVLFLVAPGKIWLAAPVPIIVGFCFGIYVIAYSVSLQMNAPLEDISLVRGSAQSLVLTGQAVVILGGTALLPLVGGRMLILGVATCLIIIGLVAGFATRAQRAEEKAAKRAVKDEASAQPETPEETEENPQAGAAHAEEGSRA